jgi:hypothetical protein
MQKAADAIRGLRRDSSRFDEAAILRRRRRQPASHAHNARFFVAVIGGRRRAAPRRPATFTPDEKDATLAWRHPGTARTLFFVG